MSSKQRPSRIVPLPFATFGELLAFGLEIHAWCGRCKSMRKVEIGPRRLRRPFAGARLRCRCGCPGCGEPVTMLTYNRRGIPFTLHFRGGEPA